MGRSDALTSGSKHRKRLDDTLNMVTDLLNTVAPGRPILELTRANGLLRQVVDRLPTPMKRTTVCCRPAPVSVRQRVAASQCLERQRPPELKIR